MDLDLAKKVAMDTLVEAQMLLRKNTFLEPIFLALTDEDVNQDFPEDDYSGEARSEAVSEGYAELMKKHRDTTEAMVLIFQSVAMEAGRKPLDLTKVTDKYHECIVCVVHTKETTAVMQSIYAQEGGNYVFINCEWDVVEKTSDVIFTNPYLGSSGNS
jgi:hypothetical protein